MAPNEVEPAYPMAVPVTPADAVDAARLDEVRDRVLAKLTPKLDLEELKKLPVQEGIRLLNELRGPPDPHTSACFDCLPLSEQVNMCRGDMVGSRP